MNNNENDNPQAKILNELKIGVDNDSSDNSQSENTNRFINNQSDMNSTKLEFDNEEKTQKENPTPVTKEEPHNNPLNEMNIEDEKLKAEVNKKQENQYVDTENKYNETSLNDLNVSGEYNQFQTLTTPFSDDEKVRENIEEHTKKRGTVTINQEMKTFIVIGIVLLIFIIIMPYVFDIITTGIRVMDSDAVDNDDAEWFTLQGFKLDRRPTKEGVYIHQGKKAVIMQKK